MIATLYSDFRQLFVPGSPIGVDGHPSWSLIYVQNLGPGFAPPVSGMQFSFPVAIDIDPGASDTVPGTDEWDWYLQLPTERAPATNRLVLQRNDSNAPTVTNSARVLLALTAVGSAINIAQTPTSLDLLFRDVHLFARNRFAGDINQTNFIRQWDLHRAVFASATYS